MTELPLPTRLLIVRLVVENQPDVVAVGVAPEWIERPQIGEYAVVPGVDIWLPIVAVYVGMKTTQFYSDGLLETVEKRAKLVDRFEKAGFKHGEAGASLLAEHKPVDEEHTGLYI